MIALLLAAVFSAGNWNLQIDDKNGAIVSLKWKGEELVANSSHRQTINLNCVDLKKDGAVKSTDGEAHGLASAVTTAAKEAPVRLVKTDFDAKRGRLVLDYETGSWRIRETMILGDGAPGRLSRAAEFRQVKTVPLKFKGWTFSLPLRLRGGYYLPGGFFTDLYWRADNRPGVPQLDWSRRRGALKDYTRGGFDRVKFAFFDPRPNLTVMAFCDTRLDGAGLKYAKTADGRAFLVDWNVAAMGWCEPGQTQRLTKQWLEVVEKSPERALDENAQPLLVDLDITVPKTRPDWVKDAAIYGIENCPFREEKLSDIPRVVAPRMKRLGLNACWYRPSEASTGRYCPIDYRVIEPKIGSAETYRAVNEAMHRAGLRVLQDLVPHGGGQLGFYLRGQSCSMQGITEEGNVLNGWSSDFADPRWRKYMEETCALYTGDWKTDGFRVDAIYGSKTLRNWRRKGWPSVAPGIVPAGDWSQKPSQRIYPEYWKQSLALDGGEMPPLAYDRASLASAWGGLRMVDAMRAGARSGCRDAALLLECGETPFVAAGDLTYDRDIQSLWWKLRALKPADFVLGLRTWLHEEDRVDPQDAVRMRYMETGDGESWPYRNYYGLKGDTAIRALCSFIHGVPMFFENFTEGQGDQIAELMRIRRAVTALRRGSADYLGVESSADDVFAFARTSPGSRALVAISFTPERRHVKLAYRGESREVTLEPFGYAVWENGQRVDRDPRAAEFAKGLGVVQRAKNLFRGKLETIETPLADGRVALTFPTAVKWELETAEGLLSDEMPANRTPRQSAVTDYGERRPWARKDPAVLWRGAERPMRPGGVLRVTDGTRVREIPIGETASFAFELRRDWQGRTALTLIGPAVRTDPPATAACGVELENVSTGWRVRNAHYDLRLLRANGILAGTDLEADRRLAGGGPYAIASADSDPEVKIERLPGRLVMTFFGELRAPYASGSNRLRLETRYVFTSDAAVEVDYALVASGSAPIRPKLEFVENGKRHDFFAKMTSPLVPRRTYRFGYRLEQNRRVWRDATDAGVLDYRLKTRQINSTLVGPYGPNGSFGVKMAWCNPEYRLEVKPHVLEKGVYTFAYDLKGELITEKSVADWSRKVSPFHPFVQDYTRLTLTLTYFNQKGEKKSLSVEKRLGKVFDWKRDEVSFDVKEPGFAPRVSILLFNEYAGVTYFSGFRFGLKGQEIRLAAPPDGQWATRALQSAIDAVSEKGWGRVTLAPGTHLIKPVELKSGVELHLEKGARLLGSPDWRDYPDHPLRHAESTICPRGRSSSLLWADEAREIALTGPGTLDGNGASFLTEANEEQLAWGFKYVRKGGVDESPPRLVLLTGCRGVRVEGLDVTGLPGGWAFWVHDCDVALFERVTIRADVNCANNDGIHINSSRDVTVRFCDITTGDDALVVRANNRSLRENRICERVVVSNCTVRSWSCGIRVGWTLDGTIRNCRFENIVMNDTTFGVGITLPPKAFIPSDYGREQTIIENLVFRNIEMNGIYAHPLYCRMWEEPRTEFAAVRDILFENCRGYGLEPMWMKGLDRHSFANFTFRNCDWLVVGDDVLPGSDSHGAAAKERHRN